MHGLALVALAWKHFCRQSFGGLSDPSFHRNAEELIEHAKSGPQCKCRTCDADPKTFLRT